MRFEAMRDGEVVISFFIYQWREACLVVIGSLSGVLPTSSSKNSKTWFDKLNEKCFMNGVGS